MQQVRRPPCWIAQLAAGVVAALLVSFLFTLGLESAQQLGVYVVSDLAGGVVAALTYNYVNGAE